MTISPLLPPALTFVLIFIEFFLSLFHGGTDDDIAIGGPGLHIRFNFHSRFPFFEIVMLIARPGSAYGLPMRISPLLPAALTLVLTFIDSFPFVEIDSGRLPPTYTGEKGMRNCWPEEYF